MRNIIGGMLELDIDELNEFQGALKNLPEENYTRLKNEINADGFAAPPFVWKNSEGKYFILDAHQRKKALARMRSEGVEIPKIKCVEILADNLKHAKRLVLAYSSQYGKMSQESFSEFLRNEQIDISDAVASFCFDAVDFGNTFLVTPKVEPLEPIKNEPEESPKKGSEETLDKIKTEETPKTLKEENPLFSLDIKNKIYFIFEENGRPVLRLAKNRTPNNENNGQSHQSRG